MKKFFAFVVSQIDAPRLTGLGVALLALFVSFFRLAGITRYLAAPSEHIQATSKTHYLITHTYGAPYYALLHISEHLHPSLLAMRLASVVFGLLAVALLYYILYKWYGYKIASLGSVLFITNSLVLHTMRITDPSVLYLSLGLVLVALVTMSYKETTGKQSWFWALGLALCLYIPGSPLLILLVFILERQQIWDALKKANLATKPLSSLLFIVLLVPLVVTLADAVKDAQFRAILEWAGVSVSPNLHGLHEFASHIINLPVNLFWRQHASPLFVTGHLPVFDVISTVLIIFGLYALVHRWSQPRVRNYLLLLLGSWLLIGLGSVNRLVVTSLLYIAVSAGLAFLLGSWFKIFPRNPFARSLAVVLMACLVATSAVYGCRSYFVAWAHSTDTKSAFTVLLPSP